MRILIALFLMLSVLTQSSSGLSMTTEATESGRYRMVLSGSQYEIDWICGFGDCELMFSTRVEATNYFYELLSAANGIQLVPLPQPPTEQGT